VDAVIEAMGEALRALRPSDSRGRSAHGDYPTTPSTVTPNEKPH
jgi:hypothetical protein